MRDGRVVTGGLHPLENNRGLIERDALFNRVEIKYQPAAASSRKILESVSLNIFPIPREWKREKSSKLYKVNRVL